MYQTNPSFNSTHFHPLISPGDSSPLFAFRLYGTSFVALSLLQFKSFLNNSFLIKICLYLKVLDLYRDYLFYRNHQMNCYAMYLKNTVCSCVSVH